MSDNTGKRFETVETESGNLMETDNAPGRFCSAEVTTTKTTIVETSFRREFQQCYCRGRLFDSSEGVNDRRPAQETSLVNGRTSDSGSGTNTQGQVRRVKSSTTMHTSPRTEPKAPEDDDNRLTVAGKTICQTCLVQHDINIVCPFCTSIQVHRLIEARESAARSSQQPAGEESEEWNAQANDYKRKPCGEESEMELENDQLYDETGERSRSGTEMSSSVGSSGTRTSSSVGNEAKREGVYWDADAGRFAFRVTLSLKTRKG